MAVPSNRSLVQASTEGSRISQKLSAESG